jgi:hypothetical protein
MKVHDSSDASDKSDNDKDMTITMMPTVEYYGQCCGSPGMFFPDPGSEFLHPGSRIHGQKDPGSGSASKNF